MAITAQTPVPVTSINGSQLTFQPAANANGPANARFTFQVQDSGSGVVPNINTDQSPNTITLNVTPVNDFPTGLNRNDTTFASTITPDFTFGLNDFAFTDNNDNPQNDLLAVHITSINIAAGTAERPARRSAAALDGNVPVSESQLTGGQLVYNTPNGARTGDGSCSGSKTTAAWPSAASIPIRPTGPCRSPSAAEPTTARGHEPGRQCVGG